MTEAKDKIVDLDIKDTELKDKFEVDVVEDKYKVDIESFEFHGIEPLNICWFWLII